MSNQEFIPASEFCDLVTDGTHDSPKKTEFGVKLVTSKNIVGGKLDLTSAYFISESDAQNINKRSQVHINDVLLSMIGTVGEVALIEKEPDFVIKNVGLLKNSDPKKAKWLYYYLKSPITQNLIKDRLRGTTQQYIPLGELRNLPILKPNSEEHLQNTIEQLSSLDKKIHLNTQINQTLEQIAQALFKSWFVDFYPVRAKVQALSDGLSLEQAELAAMQAISGKTPEELTALSQTQPERYAELAETAKAFPCEMVEIDGVKVPKGWEYKSVGDFINVVDYVANGSFATLKENVTLLTEPDYAIYIRTTDFNSGFSKELRYVDKSAYDFLAKSVLIGNEVIISNVGDVGTVFRSPSWLGMPMTLGSNAIALKNYDIPHYLYLYFSSHKGQHDISSIVTGSAQLKFNKTNFRSLNVLMPNNTLLTKFEKFVLPIFEKIDINMAENLKLAEIRDLLLPRLLSGEIEND